MNIFYIYGRSCSGKDSLLTNLSYVDGINVGKSNSKGKKKPLYIPSYTTREVRESDKSWITFPFRDEMKKVIENNKSILLCEDLYSILNSDIQPDYSIKDSDYGKIKLLGLNTSGGIDVLEGDDVDDLNIYKMLTAHKATLAVCSNLKYKSYVTHYFLISKYTMINNNDEPTEVWYSRFISSDMENVILCGDTDILTLLAEVDSDNLYTINLISDNKTLLKRAIDRDDNVNEIIRRFNADREAYKTPSNVNRANELKVFTNTLSTDNACYLVIGFINMILDPALYN